MYDKKLLQGKDTTLTPLLVVLSTGLERFDQIPEAVLKSITIAERLMESPGDLNVLVVDAVKLEFPESRKRVVSRMEKTLSDDSLRWDALKKKYREKMAGQPLGDEVAELLSRAQ